MQRIVCVPEGGWSMKSWQLPTQANVTFFRVAFEIFRFHVTKKLDWKFRTLVTLDAVNAEDLRYSGERR
jgi:hypothetical protein